MKPIVRMTGPHPSRIQRGGRALPVWHVWLADDRQKRIGTLYRCLSFGRAMSLSCNIARDRELFLHMEALSH
jgi:hypothetical protein